MKHTPTAIKLLHDALKGLSWEARAVLTAAYILGSANRSGNCTVGELRGIFEMHDDEEFKRIHDELYEAGAAYVFDGDQVDTTLGDLLAFSVGAPGRPKAKDWDRLKAHLFAEWFEHTAPYCMYCHATDVPLTLDHAQPVSRGGSNHPRNFLAACYACNSAKRDKTFAEFMAWRKERGL